MAAAADDDRAMSVEELTEDLTIQNVILASLEQEEFPGVEAEREGAKVEIERIKRLLKETRRKMTAERYSQVPSSRPSDGAEELYTQRLPEHLLTPTRMTTPRRHHDGWSSSPVSVTLPSRKREFDSTGFGTGESQSKSRRTTPTPVNGAFKTPVSNLDMASSDFDIIDLTGDDVDDDSTYIVEQIKQEQRQKQEQRDREMALRLSQSGEPSGSSSSQNTNASPHQTNALDRLMATQQSNASPRNIVGNETLPSLTRERDPADTEERFHRREIPGAFDEDSWDDMFTASRPSQGAQRSAQYTPHLQRFVPSTPQPSAHQTAVLAAMNSTGGRQRYVAPGPMVNQQRSPISLGPTQNQISHGSRRPPGAYPASQLPQPRVVPSSRPGSLSAVINNTSMFSMGFGVNEFDMPEMPERLGNYLQEAFHDPRVTEKELDDLLKNIRPDMDIPERNRDGTPAGLKSPLYPHQEVALTWMKKMEEGTNKGGILADDMGLGKTISTLALMLSRPSKSRPKTNLIIGPLSLVRQWEEEIAKKTKLSHRMSVFIYHGKKATTEEMLKYDVVLTTYGTIAMEFKRLDKFTEENADRSIDMNDRAIATKFPLLHPKKAVFYRVILDEAQCIKNKETKTAKACHKLRSTYRWCLTGTPMMNGVLELYSLVHFLRIKPYCEWEQFRTTFGTLFGKNGISKNGAMTRLRALLKAIMLRRKKDSELDGKPILTLPKKTEQVQYAELSADERDFYDQLFKKSQVQFSKYLRAGSIGKNYSNILVLLLRLRQACCHPHLNLDVEDVGTISDEEMQDLVRALDPNIVERIKAIESFECPICYDAVLAPSFFIPCGHDSCQQCLSRVVDNALTSNLQEGNESDRAKCPVCRGAFDPKKCFTYDSFKAVHMPETVAAKEVAEETASESDSDSDSDNEDASDANSRGNLRGFIVEDGFSDGEQDAEDGKKKKKKKKIKGKKKKPEVRPSMLKTLRHEAYKNREAYKRYMHYLRKTWMPAAKVTECMRLLTEIEPTGEKTIVFSQWTLLLDLLEVAMHHEKLAKPKRYDGSMSSDQRNDAAMDFRDKRDVKVMLVSLRAGNAGLNLTSASRVIIMDPFWNPYIEMQAVDRAYRIGQQNEVQVYRILTKDTVEDRIIALQNGKKEIVEAALDETESMKIGRLNVNELKFLFNTHD